MLIDPFATDWLDWLDARAANITAEERIYLLLDSAFVPGLHRTLRAALHERSGPALLFEALPGCSDEVRDVSPLVMPYAAGNAGLVTALKRCNGWPMVSAIVTSESLNDLTQRLAAWCVVENDGQRFNFRFPDTRRLPGIFNALTPTQRAQMAGPASAWHYISRDGAWKSLQVPQSFSCMASDPVLDEAQFAIMVADSESDEVLTLLQDRGRQWWQRHSNVYAQVSKALRLANEASLETDLRVEWCDACIDAPLLLNDEKASENLARWRKQILAALQDETINDTSI
jgi:hypothetical protein